MLSVTGESLKMSRIPGESKTTGHSNGQMSTPETFYRCVGSFAFP